MKPTNDTVRLNIYPKPLPDASFIKYVLTNKDFIVSGPPASGKSRIMREFQKLYPSYWRLTSAYDMYSVHFAELMKGKILDTTVEVVFIDECTLDDIKRIESIYPKRMPKLVYFTQSISNPIITPYVVINLDHEFGGC